jgi:hypothetical protein
MLELKVHCDCGQKYKFDVEPVNGQMPFTVACPICHRDGTLKANEMLQQMAVFKPMEPAPTAAAVAPPPFPAQRTAPPPVAPPIAPPPPLTSAPTQLRVNVSAPAGGYAAAPSTPPPIAPPSAAALPRMTGRVKGTSAATATEPGKQPSFALGLLGGFVGALVGASLYYVIYRTTGIRIFLALGVGALAGWGANLLGKGEGSKELGGITAVFVIVGVLAAQYFVALGQWNKLSHAYEDGGYSASVTEAKGVIKVMPTGSDAEIRMYLARQMMDENDAIKPSAVSDDEVKEFRDKQLPQYQDLASGKMTKDQYLAKFGLDPDKMKKFQNDEGDTFKGLFMLITLSRVGLISMIAGAGLAYKMSTNA